MSDQVVIDASVAIPLVRAERLSAAIDARIRAWRKAGMTLVVPGEFWIEISNVLLRRHRRPAKTVIAALHQLDELGLETVHAERASLLIALDRAERFELSVYDAVYLALAESLDAILFSADRALLAAAGPRGVSPDDSGSRLSELTAVYAREPTWPQYGEVSAFLAKLRAEAREGVRKPA